MNLDRAAIKERVEMVQQLAQSIRKDIVDAYVVEAREINAKIIAAGLKPSVDLILENIDPDDKKWLTQDDLMTPFFVFADDRYTRAPYRYTVNSRVIEQLRIALEHDVIRATQAPQGGGE